MLLYRWFTALVHRLAAPLAPSGSWLSRVHNDRLRWLFQPPMTGPVLWLHCASLGEFEMARPALEHFLERNERWTAVLTFFSPSGFEPRQNYPRATVFYLPLDTPVLAHRWLQFCRPKLAVFVRYDLWPNHIDALRKSRIPVAVIALSADRRPWYLSRFLPRVSAIFKEAVHLWGAIDRSTVEVLAAAGVQAEVLGNPKFDDVLERSETAIEERFHAWKKVQTRPVLLVGSAHAADLKFLLQARALANYSLWIVPHKLDLPMATLVSESGYAQVADPEVCTSTVDQPQRAKVLFIPEFGRLTALYALADFVFIGGAFGKAPHNALEATAQGKVAACGPNWRGSAENAWLVQHGLLHPVADSAQWAQCLDDHQKGKFAPFERAAKGKLAQQRGASARIVLALEQAVEL